MTQQEERDVLLLFDRYLNEAQNGKQPFIPDYLAECPPEETERLRVALEGVRFLIDVKNCEPIDAKDIEATLADIKIGKQRKRRYAAFYEQMLSHADAYTEDTIRHMQEALHLDSTASFSTTRRPLPSHTALSTFHRNNSEGTIRDGEKIDSLWLRMAETRIQAQAEEVLRKAESTEAPINLTRISHVYNLLVSEVALAGADGCLVTDHEIGGILLSKILPAGRKRFTWAHEIGHFILHKNLAVFRSILSKPFQSRTVEEVEAHIFASLLLMPSSLLPSDFGQQQPTLAQGDLLAKQFEVSQSAALRRMVRASHWSCAFVHSLGGEYQWHESSPEFEGFLHKRLHPSTAAAQLTLDGESTDITVTLPADLWMDGLFARQEHRVREESHRTSSGHIYTLLTIID